MVFLFERGFEMINDTTKRAVLSRLKRIEGQVHGLQRMVDEEKYCVDILLQISAVRGALEQVGKLILGRHIESCVAQAFTSGDGEERERKKAELLEVFSRFGLVGR
jgi:DNA-binding FrmR family transcriptional regulator